jgi:hypothetical protein
MTRCESQLDNGKKAKRLRIHLLLELITEDLLDSH